MSNPSLLRSATARPTSALLLAAALSAGALTACTHSTWPPIEEGNRQNNVAQFNYQPTPQVVGEALSFVTLRYPPVSNAQRGSVYEEPFAISLPEGATGQTYDIIASRVKRGIQPASEENSALYTYYVTRVIVRAVTAEVDVLRPVPELGTDSQGQPRYQGITLYLLGNLDGWKVNRHHTFPIGMLDVPQRSVRPTEAVWTGVD